MTLGSMSATDPSLVTSAAMEQTFASTRATAAAADGKPLPPDEQSGELAAMSLPRLFHWRRCIGAGWVLGTVLLWAQAPAQSPQPARPALRGATSKQVLELYGPPTSRMQAGTKEFFIYPHGGRIGFQAGIVTDVTLPPEIKRTPEVKTLLPPPPKLPA